MMRQRKPLRSRKPLKRYKPIRQKRSRPRRSGRVRDRDYLLAVKGLPCLLANNYVCEGVVQAHHAGDHPLGRKASDDTAVPLCDRHHRHLHDGVGFFGRKDAVWHRAWAAVAIAETRARLGWKAAA